MNKINRIETLIDTENRLTAVGRGVVGLGEKGEGIKQKKKKKKKTQNQNPTDTDNSVVITRRR